MEAIELLDIIALPFILVRLLVEVFLSPIVQLFGFMPETMFLDRLLG